MYKYKQIEELQVGKLYSRSEILRHLQKGNTELSDNALSWVLKDTTAKGLFVHEGRNRYLRDSNAQNKIRYIHQLSEIATTMRLIMDKNLSLADYIIWETTQYNEFLNHQLAHNIIFLEVEKVLVETAYELLSREIRDNALDIQVLVNPRIDDFARYHTNNTIIITKLTTGSPTSRLTPHQPAVEKLIVDVAANKYLKELIGKSEYENMFETIKNRYFVSPLAIKRYANRRTAMKKLRPYLPDSWVVDGEIT